MCAARWLFENEQSSSLTCIPEALVENKIIVFLNEEDAFHVRETCFHFWTAYFGQDYKSYRSYRHDRILALISIGRVYRKLTSYLLWYPEQADLSPLSRLPALQSLKIRFRRLQLTLVDTFPTNLKKLRKLDLYGIIRDFSDLRHCTELEELSVESNYLLDILTIPEELVRLKLLALRSCQLRDLSKLGHLSCFPKLNQLDLSHNKDLVLATIPDNLSQILKLTLKDCSLVDLSHLHRLPFLEELNVSCNFNLQPETIPNLFSLVKLNVEDCDIPPRPSTDVRYTQDIFIENLRNIMEHQTVNEVDPE